MLRILYIAGQLGGGGAEKQLALFLEHAGSEIEPACWVLNGGGIWHEPIRKLCARFQVSRWNAPLLREVECLQIVRRWRPDVIHCWHAYPFVYPLLSKPLHRRPIVVNVRGDLTVNVDSGRRGFPRVYRMLRFVDVVVSNSAPSLEALDRQGVKLESALVIANGIEPSKVSAPLPPRQAVGIVGIGSLRPIKNWSQLIRVCGELTRAGRPLTLTIYGEGGQRAELESLCAACGLDPRATLPGYAADLRRRLADADILAHCSRSEGLPNAILEALAEGLAVVASNLAVCRDLQERSRCLELFPVDDDAALRAALDRLISDPAIRRERREPAREFVRREFDCGEMARRYLDVYRGLVRKPSNRAEERTVNGE